MSPWEPTFTEGQPREWFDWILTGKSKKGPQLTLNHPLKNPQGIQRAADFPNLTASLLDHGYSEENVRKIMGQNIIRLFSEVWQEPAAEDALPATYQALKDKLNLSPEHRLMLESIPMVLLPRWFFVAIKEQLERFCDVETARKVFYQAGWEGATKWANEQMTRNGLDGRAVMEQYMASAGLRGWGDLKITAYNETTARVTVTLTNSAVAEETGQVGRTVCDHFPGSIAGAMQRILDNTGQHQQLIGRETKCIAKGDAHCEFEIGPAT